MLSAVKHLGSEVDVGLDCEHDVLCEDRIPSTSSGQALHGASLVQDDRSIGALFSMTGGCEGTLDLSC